MGATQQVDVVIRGGQVVDGTGSERFRADVAVDGDRIVGVDPTGSEYFGAQELDASGLVVMPGLIDVHTHYDAQVFWDPALSPSSLLGVTSVVMGNCGYSLAPISDHELAAEMLIGTMENVEDMDPATLAVGVPWDSFRTFGQWREAVDQKGCVLNYSAYVGHTTVRVAAMGPDAFERAATPAEIEAMVDLVQQAVDEGALGFATSWAPTHLGWRGKPVPSRFADRAEFEALIAPVSDRGTGMVEVTLGDAIGMSDFYDMQREAGVHFSIGGGMMAIPGVWPLFIDIHEKGIAAGGKVWPQTTPRPLTFQMLLSAPFQFNQADCFAQLLDGTREKRIAAYRDSGFRQIAEEQLPKVLVPPRWDKFLVAETISRPEWIGRRVDELAAERGETPLTVVLDLALAEDLATRFTTVLLNDDPEGIDAIMQVDHTALSFSDAGAHVGMICDAPMHIDVLANQVRRDGVLTFERAVQKMTSELADAWQFVDRGRIRKGAFADIVVLDPDTVEAGPTRRVRDWPANGERLTCDQPVGIAHILVNGTPIQVDGVSLAGGLLIPPGRYLEPAIS